MGTLGASHVPDYISHIYITYEVQNMQIRKIRKLLIKKCFIII